MHLIIITAILGVLFLLNGRPGHKEKGLERLSRLHGAKESKAGNTIEKRVSSFNRFFNRIYRILPEPACLFLRRGLDEYSAFLDYPIEILAIIRAFALLCLPLAALLLCGFSPAGIALAIPCAFIGMIAPQLMARKKRDSFFNSINRSLPHTADILYSLVLGGKNLDQAFRGAAASSPDPLRDILLIAVKEMEFGSSRKESFDRLVERYPVPQLASLLRSITEAEIRGLELSQTLEIYSRELRMRNRDELRVRVSKAPIKILVPLVFLILPSAIILAIGPTLLSTFTHFLK